MSHLKNSSFSRDINKVKDDLIKYCYVDGTNVGRCIENSLKFLFSTCINELYLRETHWFLDNYIMPMFNKDRELFNRLRSRFMKQAFICLLELDNNILSTKDYYQRYSVWITSIVDNSTYSLETLSELEILYDRVCKDYGRQFTELFRLNCLVSSI